MHYAAQLGLYDIVSLLLERGASHKIRTLEYETPLDLARKHNHAEIVELLLAVCIIL